MLQQDDETPEVGVGSCLARQQFALRAAFPVAITEPDGVSEHDGTTNQRRRSPVASRRSNLETEIGIEAESSRPSKTTCQAPKFDAGASEPTQGQ